MLTPTIWRQVFGIPWARENQDAIRGLSEIFYLLLALYRLRRFGEFDLLRRIYFRMIDSFAQYGQREARDTIDRLLEIPWFHLHRRQLLGLIAAYNRVIAGMETPAFDWAARCRVQADIDRAVADFIRRLKVLVHFDEVDDARIEELISDPEGMNVRLSRIFVVLADPEQARR
jgi:hypothetical protein